MLEMDREQCWLLLMKLEGSYEPSFTGGSWSDLSSKGYASLLNECEMLQVFIDAHTKGKFTYTIKITNVLKDGSVTCLLDDNETAGLIESEALEELDKLKELLYEEFMWRLEQKKEETIDVEKQSDIDWQLFSKLTMLYPIELECEPFNMGGYFEHPSTI